MILILIQNIEKTSVGANCVRPRATKGRPYEIWDISRIYLRIRMRYQYTRYRDRKPPTVWF